MTEIAAILRIPKWSIENHLHQLGLCLGSAYIKQKNLFFSNLISTCSSLLKCNKNVPFLKQILIGGEKWILCNNVEWNSFGDNQNEWSPIITKASLHPEKVMLYIWWDWKGVLYFELLLENQKINSNKCCSQLGQLKATLTEKWVRLILLNQSTRNT